MDVRGAGRDARRGRRKAAARALALASDAGEERGAPQMARGLEEKAAAVLDANRADLERARAAGAHRGPSSTA